MLDTYKYEYPSAYNNYGKPYEDESFPKLYDPRNYPHISRYRNTPRLFDDLFSMYYHRFGQSYDIQNSYSDKFHKVDLRTENRLDLIALQYYNNPMLWWIIAGANNIIDAFEVPIGTVLRIPALQSVYEIGGILG